MSIDVQEIKNEIVRYGKKNPLEIQSAILSKAILLNSYAVTLPKVKGEYSMPTVLAGHIVQAFKDEWNPYGNIQFKNKLMKNFHMKLNFGLNPYEIYGSWVEELYQEDKKPNEMPISQYIINILLDKIISDLNILSITGVYDSSQIGSKNPDFKKTMDGLNAVVDRAIADTTNPVFYIPVDSSLTNNIVDRVTAFEKGLPETGVVDTIFISLSEFNDYVEKRETPSNQYIDFNDPQRGKTKYGRNIVGIPGLKPGRMIAWYKGNLFRLYDRKDNPAKLDDVQVQDYIIKLFSQWHLGYDFAINQYLFVETNDSSKKRGLNNSEQNALFYPEEHLQ